MDLKKTPIHFSRFYPTYKLEQLPPTPIATLEKAAKIASEEGLVYTYTGNAPGNELSDTICPSCREKLIVRQGYRIVSNAVKNKKCPFCGTR
jgi:pyruvate formate lyase activating enzyme